MPSRATPLCEGEQTHAHTHTQANIHTHSAACLKLANESICPLQRCQVFVVRTLSVFPLTVKYLPVVFCYSHSADHRAKHTVSFS